MATGDTKSTLGNTKNSKVDEIKSKVSIPLYFERIIIPARASYYSQYGGDLNYTNRTLCPLHDEDTPSFYYREELSTYKCFGCGEYGDVISLHRKFMERETGESISFNSAINFLKKVFIDQEDVSETTSLKIAEAKDPVKFAYMNAMYARVLDIVTHNGKLSVEELQHLIWKIQALRSYAYTEGNLVVDEVASELRTMSRTL